MNRFNKFGMPAIGTLLVIIAAALTVGYSKFFGVPMLRVDFVLICLGIGFINGQLADRELSQYPMWVYITLNLTVAIIAAIVALTFVSEFWVLVMISVVASFTCWYLQYKRIPTWGGRLAASRNYVLGSKD